jgi:hypothetical protein
LALEVTGRIQVERFVFEIGHPGGTRADVAREAEGANPAPLALALELAFGEHTFAVRATDFAGGLATLCGLTHSWNGHREGRPAHLAGRTR